MTDYYEDPRLRFSIYIEGELVDSRWLDATDPGAQDKLMAIMEEQVEITSNANAAGLGWLAEIYDPAKPPGRQYTRIGTDRAHMAAPAELRIENLPPL